MGNKELDETGYEKAAQIDENVPIENVIDQNAFIKELVDSMNGSMGTYQVTKQGRVIPIYMSAGLGDMLGITSQQYLEVCKEDAMDCIHPDDRARSVTAILKTVETNVPGSISFRAKNAEGGYTWLNGSFAYAGKTDGKDMLRVVFTPATAQFEQQRDIIHNVPGGVCLYEWNGEDVVPIIVSEQFSMLHTIQNNGVNTKDTLLNYDLVHPDDLPGYKEFIRRIVLEEGVERTHQYRIWSQKKGVYIWLSVTTKVAVQVDGSILIYAGYSNIDELKQAEDKIRRNEEVLELTCSFAGVWTFLYDMKEKVCYPGKTLQESFGLQAREENFPECMINTPFIPKETAVEYRKMVKRVENGEDGFDTDLLVQFGENEKHYLRFAWKIIEYENQEPVVAIGYARGVDEEKNLEARIEMEQERVLGGDGFLLAYIVSNITKNKTMINRSFHGETPFVQGPLSMDEGAARGSRDIIDPEKQKECLEMHNRAYLEKLYAKGITSTSLEYRRRRSNGAITWEKNVLNILKEPESNDLFLYEYCYDINKEKIIEEIMMAAVTYDYERVGSINLTENQICMLETDASNAQYKLDVQNYSELCHRYALGHVIEEDRTRFLQNVLPENLEGKLREKGSFDFIHREQMEDGTIHYKQDRHVYYDREKKICLITRSDITDMVLKEEAKQAELQQALENERKAARTKSNFLSRMSHELRTPLNGITGYATLLEQDLERMTETAQEDIRYLHSIQYASKYLLTLIGDILERQQIENGQIKLVKEKVHIDTYLQNITEMVQKEAEHKRIGFGYAKTEQMEANYVLDDARLQQVLLNLLHNAMKFTPEGGSVHMGVCAQNLSDKRAELKFVVSDTGIGMSQEFMQTSLYHAFAQENQGMQSPYEGTGIGLSISKELIDLMGGSISCESEKGYGTTFTVCVPVERVSSSVKKRRHAAHSTLYDLGQKRILVCEDNQMNQEMTKNLLTRMNGIVEVADDGKIGLEKFMQSEEGYYDFVLMDLRMPVMDGYQSTEGIRALARKDAKTVPIVALSANTFDEDIRRSIESGMNEHLAKPVDARVLYEKIRYYCAANSENR